MDHLKTRDVVLCFGKSRISFSKGEWYSCEYYDGNLDWDYVTTKFQIDKVYSCDTEIYNRERHYKRYLYLLKKVIEGSKMYAEICGRPERLLRLGYFNT